jgi:hypothetical protein
MKGAPVPASAGPSIGSTLSVPLVFAPPHASKLAAATTSAADAVKWIDDRPIGASARRAPMSTR